MSGRVYWITGLAGAGKTTIGTKLYNELRKKKETVVMLDGDKLREVYGGIFGYSEEDRARGGLCNAKFCHMLAEQGKQREIYGNIFKSRYGNID